MNSNQTSLEEMKYYSMYETIYNYNTSYYKNFLLLLFIIISLIFTLMIIKKYN